MTVSVLAGAAAGRLLKLSPPLTRDIRVRRGLGLRARDGVILRTDHYAPGSLEAPTVLVRTPYGRGGLNGVAARLLAERGFHVVVSSCRGTGGSGGLFDPLWHERDDGLDTVEWLRRQPWFTGRLGTFGPSYVGYTQWAIADVPELAAMATVVTASQVRDPTYAGDSFALYTTLAWASLLEAQRVPGLGNTIEMLRGQPRLARALSHLPLGEADLLATGAEVAFFRRWLRLAGPSTEEADAYWSAVNHDHRPAEVSAPVLMVGGFHDIFLPWQLRDYAAMRAAGAQPYLTIGPWTHGSPGLLVESLRESIDWMRAHLRDEPGLLRTRPVRLYVSGVGQWREYDGWPPGPSSVDNWYLHPGGHLFRTEPAPSDPDTFVYDPSDPTPALAGPVLIAAAAKPRDNSQLEARPDVLVFTSEVLATDLDVVGPVSATMYVRGSRPHFDIFVRLCDVEPGGASVNLCDGLARVLPDRYPAAPGPTDGAQAVEVELWPTAHRFLVGHRLRVQVSGGAHPRYPRNTGTGDPLATAVDLHPVAIEVMHEPGRGSHLRLAGPASV